jgi:hypothetical protein
LSAIKITVIERQALCKGREAPSRRRGALSPCVRNQYAASGSGQHRAQQIWILESSIIAGCLSFVRRVALTVHSAPPIATIMAPACWICLGEEGDDDVGEESLVRDCSCRGESAGYAHKSCIINYATTKSKQDKDLPDLEFEAWRVCPNCNQQYQNVLRLELTRELVKFAEANHGNQGRNGVRKMIDASKVMVALRTNIQAMQDILTGKNNMNVKDAKSGASEANDNEKKLALRVECEQVVNKFLSLTLQVMKDEKMNGWIHLPSTSPENNMYKKMREFEAYALVVLGWLYDFDATNESYEIALNKWGKAKVIFKLIGDEVQLDNMAINISLTKEKQRGMGRLHLLGWLAVLFSNAMTRLVF